MSFFGNIIESVYRCDSAAVVAGAYQCGSVTREALYQGVEVVYKCDGEGFRTAAGDFYTHPCYCDNNGNNDQLEYVAKKSLVSSEGPEARNDTEAANENAALETLRIHDAISATLTFEDSILNGPNSINDLSSTGSSLLDSVSSEPKPSSKDKDDVPNESLSTGFCF
ncbi:MAG: hypothetical protein SGARI_002454 [Bacillariaceae sp.]